MFASAMNVLSIRSGYLTYKVIKCVMRQTLLPPCDLVTNATT